MQLGFTAAEERFRSEAAGWLEAQLAGPFRDLRGESSLSGKLERRRIVRQDHARDGLLEAEGFAEVSVRDAGKIAAVLD